MKLPQKITLLFLIFSTLACRPVLTVGWSEILIIGLVFLLLIIPPVWRFLKKYRK